MWFLFFSGSFQQKSHWLVIQFEVNSDKKLLTLQAGGKKFFA